MSSASPRARVLVVTEQPVIEAGLRALLAPHADVRRGQVHDLPLACTAHDVVVLDALLFRPGPTADLLERLLPVGVATLTLVRELRPGLSERARRAGVHSFVSMHAPAEAIVAAVIRHAAPSRRGAAAWHALDPSPTLRETTGLTGREVEVLRLIASGHTNGEIAATLYLSVNSVKTYIRSAYRRIDVHNRTQAVVWCQEHGLGPVVGRLATASTT